MSESSTKKKKAPDAESTPFYGWTKVSKRGQVFIPKRALEDLQIEPGDLLMTVRRRDKKGLTMVKISAMKEVLKMIQGESIPE